MYNHNKIEKKWQKYWLENRIYQFNEKSDKKFYALDMFPYPSGKGLHVGHPKGYTATDIISRYKKLNGFDVLHPIGWDAFGLPAEQYALDTNNDPNEFTQENIKNFRLQLQRLGFCFDYEKEVDTTDPKYFKWTQWIFIQLYKKGLAELKDVEVNWCEKLGTVLSNEEVLIDKNGNQVSERGSHPIEKKPMKQWVLKITKYADKLLDGLDELDWPESLKNLQRNWIGKTVGYEFSIKINNDLNFDLFTSDLNLLLNDFIILISPKSKFLEQLPLNKEITEYIDNFKNKSDKFIKSNKDYNGIKLDKLVFNPITKKYIQLYLCDFVHSEYNQNAIILPNDNIELKEFIKKHNIKLNDVTNKKIESEETIINLIKEHNIAINKTCSYKLRDWLFSRQRYWGEPFPVYFDKDNNTFLIDENELPLLLPKLKNYKPGKNGQSPLSNVDEWVKFIKSGKEYLRETNTMPQWAGSCWYYLAYILRKSNGDYIPLDSLEAKKEFEKWLPVDLYIGGQEHAVLHLLYARFWHRFLFDIGVVNTKEPFQRIINQGMILGPDGEKMSKSKGNIINPDDIIKMYGADTLRIYEMFMGPLTASMAWDDDKLLGTRKWLDRVYRLFTNHDELKIKKTSNFSDISDELKKEFNLMVKKVTFNLENYQFNLAVSNMMIFINAVYKEKIFYIEYMKDFLIILSTYAPHISEELYESLELENRRNSLFNEIWPKYEDSLLETNTINYPIMVKGKPRDVISVDVNLTEEEIKEIALNSEKVKKALMGNQIKRIIVVKNKVINILI